MIKRSAALLVFAAVVWAGSVHAAVPGIWSRPTVLAPDVGPNLPAVAVQTAARQTIAAWAGSTGVFAAVAGADRRFGKAQRLTGHQIANDDAGLLAVDGRGDAIVMWQQQYSGNPSPGALFVSYRPAHGRFGSIRRIATDAGGADVGIDADGNATIGWEQVGRHGQDSVDVIERRAGGKYGAVQVLARGAVGLSAVAVDARGDAVIVWQSGALPLLGLFASTRPAGASFGSPVQVVSPQQGTNAPETGIADDGTAWIAWEGPFDGASAGSPFDHVEVASLAAGATAPGPVQVLRAPGLGQLGDFGPLLDVDARGDAIAVWQNLTRGGNTVKVAVARRVAGGPWGVARSVGDSYPGGNFAAALGPTGRAIVAWDSLTTPVQAVIARSASGAFGPATSVAPKRENSAAPEVAIDAHGRAMAAWWDLGPSRPGSTSRLTPMEYATTN